jgi:WD40 repeat protein
MAIFDILTKRRHLMSSCPSEQIIVDFLDGKLNAERGASVHRHLDGCAACRALLAGLAPSVDRATSATIDELPPSPTHRTELLGEGSSHDAEAVAAAASVLPMITADRYDMRDEFARGGLGRIFRAQDKRLGRPVAVKQLLAGGPEAAKRFIREALITARLQHPAIVPIYEAGRWPSGEPFYAMKMVSGRSLDQVIKNKQTLAERLALLPNIIAVAEAMAYAHSQRIIHRDLKPANVLVGSFGETVLIDWGLAKDLSSGTEVGGDALLSPYSDDSTEVGTVLGTPTYMPPEQAEGKAVDERADVYALGAVIYHVLAGVPPYGGSSSAETLAKVLSEPPRPLAQLEPGVPRDLVTIVETAMARDCNLRYPTAAELAADLVRFQAGQLVSAHRYSTMEMMRRWIARHRAPVSVAVALLTTLVMTGALAVTRIAHERDRAQSERGEARAAQLQAEKRSSDLVLAQAHETLDDDPTASVAWLKLYPDAGDWRAAQAVFADAVSRGVSERVWSGASSAVYAPDGRLALYGDSDGIVRTWSAEGGSPSGALRPLSGGGARVDDVRFAPDGSAAIRREDHTLELCSAGASCRAIAGEVAVARLARDGKWLAAVSTLGGVDLWALPSGEHKTLAGAGNITTLEFGSGATVITGSKDGYVRLWDLASNNTRLVGKHEAPIALVQLSPDGKMAASGDVQNTTRLWELVSGRSRTWPGRGEQSPAFDFSANDTLVFAPGGGRIMIVDGKSGVLRTLHGHSSGIMQIRFLSDGERFVSVGEDQIVRVWSIGDDDSILMRGHQSPITDVTLAPDGTHFATGSADGTVRLWRVPGGRRLIRHAEEELYAVAVSPDGRHVAAGGTDGIVEVCDPDSSQCGLLRGHRNEVMSVAFSRDSMRLVTAANDETVRIWDLASGKSSLFEATAPIMSAALSPEGKHLAYLTSRQQLVDVDLDGGKRRVAPMGHATGMLVQFSPDGKLVATTDDHDIKLWDPGAGTMRTFSGHLDDVRRVIFSPAGDLLASAGEDKLVGLWRISDGEVRFLRGHTLLVNWVDFSRDGSQLVSCGFDGQVRLWHVRDGEGRAFVGHRGAVRRCVFSPDGKLIASGGDDDTLRLWDVASGESVVIRGHDHPVRSLAWAPDGSFIASAAMDGAIQLVRIAGLPQPLFAGHDPAALRPQLDRATSAVLGPDNRPISK